MWWIAKVFWSKLGVVCAKILTIVPFTLKSKSFGAGFFVLLYSRWACVWWLNYGTVVHLQKKICFSFILSKCSLWAVEVFVDAQTLFGSYSNAQCSPSSSRLLHASTICFGKSDFGWGNVVLIFFHFQMWWWSLLRHRSQFRRFWWSVSKHSQVCGSPLCLLIPIRSFVGWFHDDEKITSLVSARISRFLMDIRWQHWIHW